IHTSAPALPGALAISRGVGVDIDPQRIKEAKANAKEAGVADRVEFREGDLFKANIRDATVVTLYLLTSVNERLKPKLLSELKPRSEEHTSELQSRENL